MPTTHSLTTTSEVISKIEKVNKQVLKRIIQSNSVRDEVLIHCKKLYKHLDKNGCHVVNYDVKAYGKIKMGRLFPKNGHPSLQGGIDRNTRGLLAQGIYLDLDMENSNNNLLRNLCRKHNIQHKEIENYVNFRQDYLDELMEIGLNKEDAKGVFSQLINGANLDKYLKECEVDPHVCPQSVRDYNNEIHKVRKSLLALSEYKHYTDVADKECSKKQTTNIEGTAISFLLYDNERLCVTTAIKAIEELGFKVGTIIHDGMLVYFEGEPESFPQEALDAMNQAIKTQLDFDVNFLVKPFEAKTELAINDSEEDPEKEDKQSPSLLCINALKKWASEENLYRFKRDNEISVLQFTEETPYWAEKKYANVDEIINGWLAYCDENEEWKSLRNLYENQLTNNYGAMKKWLIIIDHPDFRFVKYDWRFVGYKDGIYNIDTNTFTLTGELPEEQIFCRNYFDVKYEEKPTPSFDKIVDYQIEDEDTKEDVCALFGRLHFPLQAKKDNFQVVPILKGQGETGKSTIIKANQWCFRSDAYETISANSSKEFLLQDKDTAECILVPDVPDNFSSKVSKEDYQRMVDGDMIDVNGKSIKHKKVEWNVPMLLGCNRALGFQDDGKAQIRRNVYIIWTKAINKEQIEGNLSLLLKEEAPYVFIRLIKAYHNLLERGANKSFWDICSKKLLETKEENSASQNPLISFLQEGKESNPHNWIEYVEGKVLTQEVFKNAYKKYCKHVRQCTYKWDKQCDQAVLASQGFPVSEVKVCKSCNQVAKGGKEKCCPKYHEKNRTPKITIMNMVLHQNYNPNTKEVVIDDDL